MPAGRKFQTPAFNVTPELPPVLVTVRVPVVGIVAQVGLGVVGPPSSEPDPPHPWVDSVTCTTSVPPLILHGAVPPRVQPEGLVIGGPEKLALVALHLPVATTYVVLVAGLLVPVPLPPLPVRLGTADVDPDGEWKRVKEPLPDS